MADRHNNGVGNPGFSCETTECELKVENIKEEPHTGQPGEFGEWSYHSNPLDGDGGGCNKESVDYSSSIFQPTQFKLECEEKVYSTATGTHDKQEHVTVVNGDKNSGKNAVKLANKEKLYGVKNGELAKVIPCTSSVVNGDKNSDKNAVKLANKEKHYGVKKGELVKVIPCTSSVGNGKPTEVDVEGKSFLLYKSIGYKVMVSKTLVEAVEKSHKSVGTQTRIRHTAKKSVLLPGQKKSYNYKYKCSVCGRSFTHKNALDAHMECHTIADLEKPNFTCDICHLEFKRKGSFIAHKKTHSGEKGFTCDICHMPFQHKSAFIAHMGQHSGTKPFACDICQNSFKRKNDLLIHMRTHNGLPSYTCPVCQKSFINNGRLKIHVRSHSGEKPYQCSECMKSFRYKHGLSEHVKVHIKDKSRQCSVCHKTFSCTSYLSIHMRIHSGEMPYQCPVCKKLFRHSNLLGVHVKKCAQ